MKANTLVWVFATFAAMWLDFTMVNAYYYHNVYQSPMLASPLLYAAESNVYPTLEQLSRHPNTDSGNAYSDVWRGEAESVPFADYQSHHPIMSSSSVIAIARPQSAPPQSDNDVCQTGFVEHCLVQANQDGEQRLLEIGGNQTGSTEQQTLTREFDGMCHVVIRFIDCINRHYVRCSPIHQSGANGHQLANVKDLFYQSWSKLCSADGQIRKKYLHHSKCIKQALAQNNGQEQCQARFQGYFMSGQFSLDSVENAVQYGCCAFNEWQYCIDSLIVKQCGHEAMRSVQDLIEQASGGLVSSLCDRKVFGRKSKACMGKKSYSLSKLQSLDPKMNATLHKYISIFGDFIDRLPDEEDEETSGESYGK